MKLTAMTVGAMNFQQKNQYFPGWWPVICSMQSQNFCAPNPQPIATVCQKHTHSRDIPEQL